MQTNGRNPQSKLADFPFDEPTTITFNTDRSLPGKGTSIAPFSVRLEKVDGSFGVSATFAALYGEGETPSEALGDFLAQLVPHLGWLEEQEASLELGMLAELEDLRRYVRAA